ncbi:MAG: lysophospholipid acyltransferase family protein [Methylophilaceae bacterium]
MPAARSTTTSPIIRYFRISRILLHTLVGIIIAASVLPLAGKVRRLQIIHWWCKRLLVAFNIRVISHGHVPQPNQPLSKTLFIANHISWVDIHALNSQVSLRFIAKSEIKSWPVFGYLVTKANTLFIERDKRHHAARIVQVVTQSLQAGDNLCLFPEGTTTDGTEIKPFKSSLIQAALLAKASIQPVAIRYPHPDNSINTAMAYAGETTMLESMQRVLQQKNPLIELHFLPPISTADLAGQEFDRRALMLQIQQLIAAKLGL